MSEKYIFFILIAIGFLLIKVLIALFRWLLFKQVSYQVEEFSRSAKIPKVFRDGIKIKIKWF
tara:strand:- start:904 stop:1089 length:186 start_codon:yes stop_codon:yes gene_type:complete